MGTSVIVQFTTGPAVPGNSSIVVDKTNVPADGTSVINATLTFKDGTGNPVSGKPVGIMGHGSAHVTPAAAMTDASGQAVFALTDTVAESMNISGFDSSDVVQTPTVEVSFASLAPTEDTLDIESSASTDPDDGSTAVTLTVTVTNGGLPVEGKTVHIQQTVGGHATVTPPSATTDAEGKAVFSATDTNAETLTFTPMES